MKQIPLVLAGLAPLLLPGVAFAGEGDSPLAQLAGRPVAFWLIAAVLGAAAWWSTTRRR